MYNNFRMDSIFNNRFLYIIIFILLTSCSQTPTYPNEPLDDKTLNRLAPERFAYRGRNDDISIILTFSGGGTRAAAFSYGVLKGFRNTNVYPLNDPRNLLSMVDVISSVSGGSFTSAYYGLFGDKLFSDFEKDFLKTTLQSRLSRNFLFNPINWVKFMSGNFNRSHLTAQYYQKLIFKEKTFADMLPESPTIIINATDIATGAGFSFTEDYFRWLCSDLKSFQVGKAVTASSAVPILFSPVMMKNYKGCDPFQYQINTVNDDIRFKQQALLIRNYKDKIKNQYLHLVDGGVADNLGVRALLNQIYRQDNNFWQTLKTFRLTNTKKVLFVVVNASATLNGDLAESSKTPSLSQTINAVTTIQSQNFNNDTLDLLELSIPRWVSEVKKGRCAEFFSLDCNDFEFYVTELNFNQLGEPLASELASIETALQLPTDQVDQLILAGESLVKSSSVIKEFISKIKVIKN
jgi:NTE family protein